MKYIDAEKLKEEIESISLIPQTSADYNDGRDDMKMMILDIIDSLQQKQQKVDLEKELKTLDNTLFDLDGVAVQGATHYLTVEDVKQIAKNFFELGVRTKDVNEIIKTAEDHAYFAGSENTREKLIDKACEWLLNNVRYYSTNALGAEYMCEDFRKAMEE